MDKRQSLGKKKLLLRKHKYGHFAWFTDGDITPIYRHEIIGIQAK